MNEDEKADDALPLTRGDVRDLTTAVQGLAKQWRRNKWTNVLMGALIFAVGGLAWNANSESNAQTASNVQQCIENNSTREALVSTLDFLITEATGPVSGQSPAERAVIHQIEHKVATKFAQRDCKRA